MYHLINYDNNFYFYVYCIRMKCNELMRSLYSISENENIVYLIPYEKSASHRMEMDAHTVSNQMYITDVPWKQLFSVSRDKMSLEPENLFLAAVVIWEGISIEGNLPLLINLHLHSH